MPLPCWRRHSIRSVDVDSDPRPDLIQTLYASRAWISDRSGSTALQSNDALCTSVLLTHLQPLAFQARQLVSAPDIFTSLAHSIRTPCRRTRSTLRDLDEQACRSPWLQTSSPLRSCACSPFAHPPLLPLTCQGDAVYAPVAQRLFTAHLLAFCQGAARSDGSISDPYSRKRDRAYPTVAIWQAINIHVAGRRSTFSPNTHARHLPYHLPLSSHPSHLRRGC